MTGFGNKTPGDTPRFQIVLHRGCTHVDGVLHFAPGGVNSADVNDGDFLHAPDGERLRVRNVEMHRKEGALFRTGTLVVERACDGTTAGSHGPGSLFTVEPCLRENVLQTNPEIERGIVEEAAAEAVPEEQTGDEAFQVPAEVWNQVWEIMRHHPPTPDMLPRFGRLRRAAALFASVILAECPPCADRQEAFNLVRRALMQANAAVALEGKTLDVARSREP